MLECDKCDGSGCPDCNFVGRMELADCPLEFITDDVWQTIKFAEFFKKGLPPVAGGVLDQAYLFLQACEIIWNEQDFWRRKLGIISGDT